MTQPDIDHLIILYLSNKASEREKAQLEEWIHASQANKAVFQQVREIWMKQTPAALNERISRKRDEIWMAGTCTSDDADAKSAKTGNPDIGYWMKVAATLLILVISGWLMYKWSTPEPVAIAFVEKDSAAGERSMYILPDGTEAWLNSESSLRYLNTFSDTLRLVELTGEAWFDVAHDANRPFIVLAAGTSTEALGTTFNIRAYEDDAIIKVALLEGKVRVKEQASGKLALLSPGEQVVISKDGQRFSVLQFDYEKSFGWKDGVLVFDGDDFKTFCEVIERVYGVNVRVVGAPKGEWKIRARYANERLSTVMQDISFSKNFTFELKDRELTINFKVKPMI